MTETYSDVYQSFERCLRRRDFLWRFYTLFTESDPQIAKRFQNTDWNQQIHLLRHGISASIMYAAGGGLGRDELDRLRDSHGSDGYNIPDWMYDNWLEALIQTLSETDSRWSPELERQWRAAMGAAIEHISGRDGSGRRKGRSWFSRR